MPLVATPILAYMATTKKIKQERENNKQEEASKRFKPNDTEWNEKQSRKTLAEHNITSKQEQDKYIGSDGKLNTDGNKKTSFKASTDDQQFAPAETSYSGETYGDIPQVYEPAAEISSIEETQIDNDLSDISRKLAKLEDIDNLSDLVDLGVLDDLGDVITAGGVLSELIPGAKFFKPIRDLLHGDFKKATIGGLTRFGETAILPIKGLYVGGVSLCCGIFKRAGFDDDCVGFRNGAKLAVKNWARGRDELEDTILCRETLTDKITRAEKELKKKRDSLEKKKQNILEQKRKREEENNRKLAQHQREISRSQELIRVKEEKERLQNNLQGYEYFNYTREERKAEEKKYKIYKTKEQLYSLVDEYKQLCPDADISKYTNVETSWDLNSLANTRKQLQKMISEKKNKNHSSDY